VKIPSEKLNQLTITDVTSGKTTTPGQAVLFTGELELNPGVYHLSATYNN
jgi:hypothetical protein